jgi:hypothetical protein
MLYVLIGAMLLLLFFAPSLWAGWVMNRHAVDRPDMPGTGGELANHLVTSLRLTGVTVEPVDGGDHYDPESKTVRLSRRVHDGKSLTAVAVAAHEVGHALQDHLGYAPLHIRSRLVKTARRIERIGSAAMVVAPLIAGVTHSPRGAFLAFLAGLAAIAAGALVHMVTLPVEIDASFRRALPLLEEGGYVTPAEAPAIRQVLTAAALTYVAASLAGLLNLWRWATILVRR